MESNALLIHHYQEKLEIESLQNLCNFCHCQDTPCSMRWLVDEGTGYEMGQDMEMMKDDGLIYLYSRLVIYKLQ